MSQFDGRIKTRAEPIAVKMYVTVQARSPAIGPEIVIRWFYEAEVQLM